MYTDPRVSLAVDSPHWILIQARNSEVHMRREGSSMPQRRPLDVLLLLRRVMAGRSWVHRRGSSNTAANNLDDNRHQRRACTRRRLRARRAAKTCARALPVNYSRWVLGTGARTKPVRRADKPRAAARAWLLPARGRTAWRGCAAAAAGWSRPRRARRWTRTVVRRPERPAVIRPAAMHGAPRRARRPPHSSSWSTKLDQRSGRRRALATRQARRRARRGPRHGCQGTGWRPGKPRGSGRVAGRFTRAAGTSHRAHTRPTHRNGTWKLKRDSRFSQRIGRVSNWPRWEPFPSLERATDERKEPTAGGAKRTSTNHWYDKGSSNLENKIISFAKSFSNIGKIFFGRTIV